MMTFLADENFLGGAVKRLRAEGYDIDWVAESSSGITDEEVIELASRDGRILLTFDKDFGELAFRVGLTAISGIVLFRIPMSDLTNVPDQICKVLQSRTDWSGHFSVIEPGRIRMRLMP